MIFWQYQNADGHFFFLLISQRLQHHSIFFQPSYTLPSIQTHLLSQRSYGVSLHRIIVFFRGVWDSFKTPFSLRFLCKRLIARIENLIYNWFTFKRLVRNDLVLRFLDLWFLLSFDCNLLIFDDSLLVRFLELKIRMY